MSNIYKKATSFLLAFIMCISFIMPTQAYASEVENKKFTYNELITIADPYIEESGIAFRITNSDELRDILGNEYYTLVENRVKAANAELGETLDRDAVTDTHVAILREAGATVEYHWWGKRVLTNSRSVAINVRNLANAFSGAAGTAGMETALLAAGISFIPGLGTAATIAGVVVGIVAWADSTTWSTVNQKVAEKIDVGKYKLTIDINGWDMDVQVY